VVEASAEDKRLVGPHLAVGQSDSVLLRLKLGHFGALLDLGPGVDHGGQSSGLHLQFLDVGLKDAEVRLGLDPIAYGRNHSHLEVVSALVGLEVLGESTAVRST